ncbi:hypothetical protein HY086_00265 [Candidatus Gottesmanbacteria bacterium]|nr:hypothetical protein [Candidatus Gottesmanbacteria bacterium]
MLSTTTDSTELAVNGFNPLRENFISADHARLSADLANLYRQSGIPFPRNSIWHPTSRIRQSSCFKDRSGR